MSEKSKGDTSSPSTLAQIKNNPLLSASVTGMLLDDFPNKPLLLPAAPPIVTTSTTSENPNNRKSSPTATVGETPDIDAEQFSEINLNTSTDGPISFSLQSDINDNPFPQIQHEPPAHSPSEFADESILSQAASSFSQLPSVASTVLSKFSKVINNYTPTSQGTSRETSSERDLLQNTQQQQLGLDQYPRSDNTSPAQSTNLARQQIDPPTFFTPSDYGNQSKPSIPVPQLPPPLTVGTATGNTYRLTTKKKTYAQIPGLSKQLDQNIPEKNIINQPLPSISPNSFETGDTNRSAYPPQPPILQQSSIQTELNAGDNILGQNNYITPGVPGFQQLTAEDTTIKTSSIFSLSNIVPPVIQNFTGFVKSTVTGAIEPAPVVQQQKVYNPQDQNQSSHNYFDCTSQQAIIPPTVGFANPEVKPVNYFVPSEGNKSTVSSGEIGFESIQSSVKPPTLQTTPPKPPHTVGTSSFRLQKGTRLYKSAFDQSTAPSAPSIQAAFSIEPTVPQAQQRVSDIYQPISPQTSTNFNLPPSVVTGLPPLPISDGNTNFFASINTTSSFIESKEQSELAQIPLYNPLNNQQSNSASDENKVSPIIQPFNPTHQLTNSSVSLGHQIPVTNQIFNPINSLQNSSVLPGNKNSEIKQVFNAPNQHQNIYTSTENKIIETTPIFHPITQVQNTSISPGKQIPEISQFFNTNNQLHNPLVSQQNKAEAYNVIPQHRQPISAALSDSHVPLSLQTFDQQSHPPSTIFNPVKGNPTEFESDQLIISPESIANHQVSQAAIFNPSQELQSSENFFQSFPLQHSTVDQHQFFEPTYNHSQNTSSIPNFPPPPIEKPEPKEDQYDSVPLLPPSIDQKPIEPLTQQTSLLSELQPPIPTNQLPVGPALPINQHGSNPFRRISGLNNKLAKTLSPPPPTQFSDSSQLSPVNFFNPQQLNQTGSDNNISDEIIIANTINFRTEQDSGELKTIPGNSQQTCKSELPVEPVSTENIKQIESYHKNTADPINNFNTDKHICAEEETLTTQTENKRKDSSNLSNYFGDVCEPKEISTFSNIITSSSTKPVDTKLGPPHLETISSNKFSDFENQLPNKFDNKDHIHHSYQSEQTTSVPTISNFFLTNNQNQINNQPDLQSTISPPKSEENFDTIQKNTTEKLEKSQENLFTNYFTSINQQQQHQNIEKQTVFFNSANLSGNLEENLTRSDPSTFFDSFNNNSANSSVRTELNSSDNQIIEDPNSQRIQNFFNNPPPQNLGDSINDINYNFYGGNQDIVEIKKQLLTTTNNNNNNNNNNRPLTPASNLVEPPSSACSEFSSEFNNSLGGQQQQILDNLKKLSTDELPEEILEELNMAKRVPGSSVGPQKQVAYKPVEYHWFFKKSIDAKQVWTPFSHKDSQALEENFTIGGAKIIAVEGGRYDVNINEKTRIPVYWNGDSSEVRRCSWFYKAIDSKYVPYDEATSDLLELEYKNASNNGEWHKKIALQTGETVVFHGPTVMVHFLQSQIVDAWGGATQSQSRPRVVKRDLDDFVIEAGETNKVDHVLFMVHGIGSGCDLKFRSVEEVVEEFRSIAYQLVQSHYKNSCDVGEVGRVEVLPVSWHDELHSKESGIDEKLKAITLESIPRLRNFANDTVLDVLFYTSPVFCQSIITTVANCMNRVYLKYCERNTNFNGQISLAGHSLGSLILFDLLCHQKPIEDNDIQNSENPDQIVSSMPQNGNNVDDTLDPSGLQKQVSYTIGSAGTGQPFINYPQLLFAPKKFFALGSPIGMFVTIRGIDSLGLDFKLPTCPGFYNIFHPYDPVAYRVEALINPELSTARPVLIPHHKGRKRMHLELKETMTRVGTEVKQKIVETFKNTVFFMAPKSTKTDAEEIEEEVDKVLDVQLKIDESSTRIRTESTSSNVTSEPETAYIDLPLGKLNDSKRIDYVLQEAPLEFFNEYLFALTSHVCYWESADTILFVVKEIYSSLGITTDSQVPQQTMTIERPNSTGIQS